MTASHLVVNQSGKPGGGFIAWDVDNYEEGFSKVSGFNWEELDNPFSYASDGERYDQLVTSLVDEPDESDEGSLPSSSEAVCYGCAE